MNPVQDRPLAATLDMRHLAFRQDPQSLLRRLVGAAFKLPGVGALFERLTSITGAPLAAVPAQTNRPAVCPPSYAGTRPFLRSVCAQDRAAMGQYLTVLGADRRRLRFHGAVNPLSERLLSQMTRGDGGTLLALVAVLPADDGDVIVGEACCARSTEDQTAEFAISVAQASQGSGLAQQLLDALLQAAAAEGIVHVVGEVLEHNGRMANFLTRSGFEPCDAPEAGVQRWQITLASSHTGNGSSLLDHHKTKT